MWFRQNKIKNLIWFTEQFHTLTQAGLSFAMSLEILRKTTPNPHFAKMIAEISKSLEKGMSFSTALSKHPELFDIFYIEMVRIGEYTGKLQIVLQELCKYWQARLELWQALMRALTYPLFVMGVMLLLTFTLCFSIVPRFQMIFASFNAPLPWITECLFTLITLMREHFMIITLVLGVLGWMFYQWGYQQLKRYCAKAVWIFKIPVMGVLYHEALLFRFFKTLGIAIQAGLSMQESLQLMRKMFTKTPMQRAISIMMYDLKQGRSLSMLFASKIYFKEICTGFIKIAEETGTMEVQFLNLAQVFEKEIEIKLERCKVLLEPLMLLLTGAIVGGVVLAIYYPIFALGGIV